MGDDENATEQANNEDKDICLDMVKENTKLVNSTGRTKPKKPTGIQAHPIRKMLQAPNSIYKSYNEFKKQYFAEREELSQTAHETDQKEAMRQFNLLCTSQ